MIIQYRIDVLGALREAIRNCDDSDIEFAFGDRSLSWGDFLFEVNRHTDFGEEQYRIFEESYNEGARL